MRHGLAFGARQTGIPLGGLDATHCGAVDRACRGLALGCAHFAGLRAVTFVLTTAARGAWSRRASRRPQEARTCGCDHEVRLRSRCGAACSIVGLYSLLAFSR